MSKHEGDEGFDFSAWSVLNEQATPRSDRRPPLGSRYPVGSPDAIASPINHDDRGERWGGSIQLPTHLRSLAEAVAKSDGSAEQTRPPWWPSPV